jgi:hypothetical protein
MLRRMPPSRSIPLAWCHPTVDFKPVSRVRPPTPPIGPTPISFLWPERERSGRWLQHVPGRAYRFTQSVQPNREALI